MDEDTDVEDNALFDGVDDGTEQPDSGGGLSITPEDRPRGILSKTDREYLCGLKEYAQPQTDANRRQDIRERVENGLKDFALLWMLLKPDERGKVFDELGEDGTDEVIESMITFAYLGIDQDTTRLEECIERGVLAAANADKLFRSAGRATDADVSIDIEYKPDAEKLYQRFEEGAQLSDAEVGVLVRSGKIDAEDIEELQDSEVGFPGVYAGGKEYINGKST
jgi:hypothetical protein